MSEGRLGAVLAGGRSRRMGRDKARLEVGGRTLVERAAERLAPLVEEVLVVGGEAPSGWSGAPWIADDRPGLGPLGGLATALRRASGDVLVLACDLPRVDGPLLARLAEAPEAFGRDGPEARVAAEGGRVQPLCALYSGSCRRVVDACLGRGELAVHAALEGIRVTRLEVAPSSAAEPLLNLNTPEDYRRLVALEGGGG